MARVLLHPERVRCRTCRKRFGFVILLRAYCSEECAGLPDRPINPEDLPRQCRVKREGTWRAKDCYFSPREAEWAAKRARQYSYLCEPPIGCGMYHLSSRPKPYNEMAAQAAGEDT